MHRVFVYGTLKKGFSNHNRILAGNDVKISPVWTYGELYDLGWGFPAMTKGSLKVYGDLLEFNDLEILNRIDMLEGYRGIDSPYNFYTRKEIQVFKNKNSINSWVYLLEKDRILDDNGLLISSGKWGKYRYSS